MSARDTNSRLVIQASVLIICSKLTQEKKKKKRSQHETHSDCRGPHEPCLKIQQKMSSSHIWSSFYKCLMLGFPGGAVVENLPANAGDTGSHSGLGGSHMPRSNWAREPQLLSLRVWSLCSATREATIVRGPHTAMKSGPRLPQLEKALAQKRRPQHSNQSINK